MSFFWIAFRLVETCTVMLTVTMATKIGVINNSTSLSMNSREMSGLSDISHMYLNSMVPANQQRRSGKMEDRRRVRGCLWSPTRLLCTQAMPSYTQNQQAIFWENSSILVVNKRKCPLEGKKKNTTLVRGFASLPSLGLFFCFSAVGRATAEAFYLACPGFPSVFDFLISLLLL